MSVNEWKHELQQANNAYDTGRISRESYEVRIVMAIYMIAKDEEDTAMAIARAHGYHYQDIIRHEGRFYDLDFKPQLDG